MVGKSDKLIYFWCFNWIGWETGKEKMVLARRVLESWERGRESNCKHDQQNNLLHVQSPFKCKLPKVIFFVWNF